MSGTKPTRERVARIYRLLIQRPSQLERPDRVGETSSLHRVPLSATPGMLDWFTHVSVTLLYRPHIGEVMRGRYAD